MQPIKLAWVTPGNSTELALDLQSPRSCFMATIHPQNLRDRERRHRIKIVATRFIGGCLCGAVRYECTAEPIAMLKCHCRDCQQATGGPYAAAILFPAKALKITKGKLRYHLQPRPKGGQHKRGFCADCGSRITGGESDKPSDTIGILAGSLDDPSLFQPTMDIFTEDAQPWDSMSSSTKKYKQYPE
jgi:hypothetical protein